MSLATPESVQKLQAALHDKAKKSPNFCFHALYDKVYRRDVLTFAYACSKANDGASRGGWTVVRGHRGIWCGAIVGRTDVRAEEPNLSTTSCAAGLDTEAGPEDAAAVRSTRYPGSRPDDGDGFCARPHLRGRPRAGRVRLSARPQRAGRGKARPQADQHRTCRNR